MSDDKRKSVFISYAHKDGLEFVESKLAPALEIYMDVFWDAKLRTGNFSDQLLAQIENTDFFIFVMTPQSFQSEWCKKELSYAEDKYEKKEGIALAKIRDSCGGSKLEIRLVEEYTFGDFSQYFDKGFKRLTQMMLGYGYSSWEHLVNASDKELLLEHLPKGDLPALISQEITEWVLVNKIWDYVIGFFEENMPTITLAQPKTAKGISSYCPTMYQTLEYENNIIAFTIIQNVETLINDFLTQYIDLNEDMHTQSGKLAYSTIAQSQKFLKDRHEAENDVLAFKYVEANYDFDVAEKLREFINLHARRSRYLY